ncbi:AAA family ATPase [Thalassotalea nanhaiensis]|uniref:AAA family ATPase n=1 Tax=Thalassotalea nanhaiensis TaxID=3065648 RepID=A0ABY9TFV5_9GAMM|nr:AAA family ATPase [Colwelliaceae bacterium SQ345]
MNLFKFNKKLPDKETDQVAEVKTEIDDSSEELIQGSSLDGDQNKLEDGSIDFPLKGEQKTETVQKNVNTEKESLSKELDYLTIAPTPQSLIETGLSTTLLIDLMLKHLQNAGILTLKELSTKLCISGSIIQELIDICKAKSWVENVAQTTSEQMRFSLSSIGQLQADKALLKNGYLGTAPIPLEQYTNVCLKQTSRDQVVTNDDINSIFSDLTFSDELIEKIGPSLNSIKPILIYGAAGTGKSFFCRHLNLVFGGDVLVPHAIEVNNEIVQVFDPEIHQLSEQPKQENVLKIASSFDPRWLLCKRPLVVSGGELSAEMLEVRYDKASKIYRAPLQLKANNGILLLDDLGRQKITPKELFNRWIIPLEERRDFLSLQSGLHFELPFELLLLFSTNLTPTDLVDEAFLRRLGYKVEFEQLTKELYQDIWFKECIEYNLLCEMSIFDYLVEHLHQMHNRKFLPCYPRDLLSIVSDQIKFKQLESTITKELLDFAWHSYFVK